jgi:hypothetical protein
VPHAKTSCKLINTTFIIGGNFQTKKGSLTVASVARHLPLYYVTPSLTFRTLLERMQTAAPEFFWLLPIRVMEVSEANTHVWKGRF